jgi:ornithine cyclodeaminase/alanine dehydrogenase-like protein (mu-crystallin family)
MELRDMSQPVRGQSAAMRATVAVKTPNENSRHPNPLFISHADCLKILTIEETMRICEEVFQMHARGSVSPPIPPAFKLDDDHFKNHWHVKGVLLKEIPITGVRLYDYYDDGSINTVGRLDCTRYVVLSDPRTGYALAIVDEHLSYGWRSAAAAVVPMKWVGPVRPRVLGLIGIGSMCTGVMQCLLTMYRFDEIRITSRHKEARQAYAKKWSEQLGLAVRPFDNNEELARGADIIVGGTTSSDVMIREAWVKPGAVVISLARQQFELSGFSKMDKVVVDDWELNMRNHYFRKMVDDGLFSRSKLHADIPQLTTNQRKGRERDDERILIHTTGFVSQDIAISHWIYEQAKLRSLGITLPAARAESNDAVG